MTRAPADGKPSSLAPGWARDVLVIHNQGAGDGSQPAALLRRVLSEAGYRPRYVSTDDDWRAAVRGAPHLIVLIGGDGTVSRAVRLLGGDPTPVALLPTGSANNLAKVMGVAGDARDVVRSWRDGGLVTLDVWEARGAAPDGEAFVEAIGGGVIASHIARGREAMHPSFILGSYADRALHLLREATRDEPARPWGLEVDGIDHSDELIGLEVMNGPYVGPSVPLAAGAHPGDGGLDVVLMRAGHRAGLLRRFASLAAAQTPAPGTLDVIRGHEVRVRPPSGVALHLDGDPWRPALSGDGWIDVVPSGPVNIVVAKPDAPPFPAEERSA